MEGSENTNSISKYNNQLKVKKNNKMEELYNNKKNFQPDFYYLKIENNKLELYFKNEEKNIKKLKKNISKLLSLIKDFKINFEKTNELILKNFKSNNILNLYCIELKNIFFDFNKDIKNINYEYKLEINDIIDNFNGYSNKEILSITKEYLIQYNFINNNENQNNNRTEDKEEEKFKILKKNLIKEYINNYEEKRQNLMISFLSYVIGIQLKSSLYLIQSNTLYFNKIKKLKTKKEEKIKNEIIDYQKLFLKS